MASLQQEVLELSKRLDELAAKVAPPDDDVQKHRGPIEVLIANQQEIQANQKALQDAVISSQKALQDAVISSLSSQKALQDALAAQSQQRNCGCNIC
jgi:chromosome segregation ATPase